MKQTRNFRNEFLQVLKKHRKKKKIIWFFNFLFLSSSSFSVICHTKFTLFQTPLLVNVNFFVLQLIEISSILVLGSRIPASSYSSSTFLFFFFFLKNLFLLLPPFSIVTTARQRWLARQWVLTVCVSEGRRQSGQVGGEEEGRDGRLRDCFLFFSLPMRLEGKTKRERNLKESGGCGYALCKKRGRDGSVQGFPLLIFF